MFGGSDHIDSECGGPYNYTSPKHNNHQESKNWNNDKVKWHASTTTTQETSIPTPSIPVEPSEIYLATSLKPSYRISQPSPKLLILDLNGTLLYRLPPPSRRSSYQIYSDSSPAPSRATYLRPYFLSFRQYLFHATTRAWLDVMVWSSAQPHSVKSMLKLCFPREGENMETINAETEAEVKTVDDRFFAVWARDTLGLSRADYSRKIQTIKNLEKVWTEFATISRSSISGDSTTSESNLPANNNNPLFSHSSLSTLLLDDSPLKARLQPWNHLCIKEYDEAIRKKDTSVVQSLSWYNKSEKEFTGSVVLEEISETNIVTQKTKLSAEIQETETSNHDSYLQNQPPDPAQISPDSISYIQTDGTNAYSPSAPITPNPLSPDPPTNPDTTPLASIPELSSHLDETLLAVIGILEELKYQSNVSSWFRNRGLWTIKDDDKTATAENHSPRAGSDINSQPILEDILPSFYSKVMSLTPEDVENMPIPGLFSAVHIISPSTSPKRCLQDDVNSDRETKRLKLNNGVAIPSQNEVVSEEDSHQTAPLFWFEDKNVLAHWVQRGRQILRELDIPELHGLDMGPGDGHRQ
ncbi:hypothetical protein Clacol_008573 [Clathrus columnatus]|uniref:Mitochondrial import inner membrane translocase subunit TIM50 n=1 Tax=Clathrus columnatus TaxID=1419009 RepID=A0AAV5AI77_9AGAM|nr:hypothetical protein Clacol_008573 [Clathrus columnatus]